MLGEFKYTYGNIGALRKGFIAHTNFLLHHLVKSRQMLYIFRTLNYYNCHNFGTFSGITCLLNILLVFVLCRVGLQFLN